MTIAGRRIPVWGVIAGVVALLLVLTCGCCGTVALAGALTNGNGNGQTTAPATHTPQQQPATSATATPQEASKATVTPIGPQPIHAAILGGTEQDFSDAWGSPQHSQGSQRDYLALINDQFVIVDAALRDGTGGQRFWSLIILPSDTHVTWDQATAEAMAKALIPSDAVYQRDMQVSGFGPEHLYRSVSLAASFPARTFTNIDSGDAVPPGTFYVSCGNTYSTRGGCTIQTGA